MYTEADGRKQLRSRKAVGMGQNIIAYTVILFAFASPGLFLLRACKAKAPVEAIQNLAYAIICLMVAGWLATAGMAYHVRSFNEAKRNVEHKVCLSSEILKKHQA